MFSGIYSCNLTICVECKSCGNISKCAEGVINIIKSLRSSSGTSKGSSRKSHYLNPFSRLAYQKVVAER